MDPPTPPRSPKQVRSSGNWSQVFPHHKTPAWLDGSSENTQPEERGKDIDEQAVSPIIESSIEFDLSKDENGRPVIFGEGAWSKVYKADTRTKLNSTTSAHGRLTPPGTPFKKGLPRHVAVKAPLCNTSRPILRSEALILSLIQHTPQHEEFVVSFYGFVSAMDAIVLDAVPMSLSEHITSRNKLNRLKEFGGSGLASTDPILGNISVWLDLAEKLVTALQWLHETAQIVHGDIKLANILLSPKSGHQSDDVFHYTPLLIDFSSSHSLSSPPNDPNTLSDPKSPLSPSSPLSAITREYTAPELLSPTILRDPSSKPTTISDIFSLAITLLVCATGDLLVYSGNVWQRQHMATQGWEVLGFVRNNVGESGWRVPEGGVVDRVIEGAVRRDERKRLAAREWREGILREREAVAGVV